ncbi:twin-arginine translocation pathway signal protein [Variovorax sp. RKNM96]|uniref:Acg family FMN-binding oxidoreductase n=1 Tax=Variovorax sp. RKNM96 TaxID=2681552 RepID=UPI001F1282ED|nr:twin-arginine translocation pathway signal protein [Variovorax sp. RKNM96]
MDERRNFVRLLGGGVVVAAGAVALATWWLHSDIPAAALEIWNGPGNEPDARKRAVAYAVTAPTAYNCQPWLVDLREPEAIVLYCDRERLLPETDPYGRQALIGHGAFIELLVMALAQQGILASVQLWPQGELPSEPRHWPHIPVARLRLSSGGAPDPLFAQVLRRRTPKQRFDTGRPVSSDMLQGLTAIAPAGGTVQADGTVDMARVRVLRKLCAAAARVEIATPGTALENLRMLRVGPQEILEHRDGFSRNDPALRLAIALGQFDRNVPAAEDSESFKETLQVFEDQANTAMGFVWLSTRGNSRTDQIAAGRAYVRQQLRATDLGVGLHPMSQPLEEFAEMAPHHAAAHDLLLGTEPPRNARSPTLQMMCRLGYPMAPVPAAPRRAIGDFMMA